MKSRFCIIFIVFTALLCPAQDYQDDAVLWTYVYAEKKLNDKFDLHLNHQSRFHNNISMYRRASFDLGITYHLNKNVRIQFDYMYMYRRNNDLLFAHRHRLYAALILRKKIRNWTVSYRNRVQGQVNEFYSSADGQVPIFYERNKLTLKYDVNKRWSSYVSGELFLPFYQARNKGFDRLRSFVGINYNITKKKQIELYFGYQHELNAFNVTRRLFIYGAGYSFEF